jgi:hypothetical protein
MLVKDRSGRGVLLAAVLMGIASVAHAGDVQIVHGSTCRQLLADHDQPTYWLLSGFSATSPWAPVNSAAQAIDVVCPLVRDSTRTVDGKGLGLIGLRVYGYVPSTAALSCTALLLNGTTGALVAQTPKISTGMGNVTLDFGSLFYNMGNAESVYQLKCNVPADGSIFSIRYDERE